MRPTNISENAELKLLKLHNCRSAKLISDANKATRHDSSRSERCAAPVFESTGEAIALAQTKDGGGEFKQRIVRRAAIRQNPSLI